MLEEVLINHNHNLWESELIQFHRKLFIAFSQLENNGVNSGFLISAIIHAPHQHIVKFCGNQSSTQNQREKQKKK